MAEIIYTGDGGVFKVCTKCDEVKASGEFRLQPRGLLGRQSECTECNNLRHRAKRIPIQRSARLEREKRHRERNPIILGIPHRICLGCNITKLATDYYLGQGGKLRSQCKECCSTKSETTLDRFPVICGVQHRICAKCDIAKPLTDFYNSKSAKLGVTPRCKECTNSDQAQRYAVASEGILARNRQKRRDNPDAFRAKDATRNARRRADPLFALEAKIRTHVYHGIKRGAKKGRRTFDLLGYSPDDLKRHLERQFTRGMSWENYGRNGWHVDHILPLAMFNYDTPDSPEFKYAWSLSNLRPLWESENASKRDRRTLLV